LRRAGAEVSPWLGQQTKAPVWMQQGWGMDTAWSDLTLSCLPVLYLYPIPGRHWLLSMTEGSEMPDGWAEIINKRNIERVIVPCEANAETFREAGVKAPVHVIPGGTDPDEFPVITTRPERPYTFLALGDRGSRKGWAEVWQAFYGAFGTPQDTPDVRLIIKVRPESNDLLDMIGKASNPDPRIRIWNEDVADMREVYAAADCFCFPSRFEGWGMPPREAAMMGLPVIVQQHSGLDDGHTDEWALTIPTGKSEAIPTMFENIKGQWWKADIGKLADAMHWCYDNPDAARRWHGIKGAAWLREYQTWDHSALKLLNLIREVG
jgi:glycosyltransferase involved in cell wall biosynthesis